MGDFIRMVSDFFDTVIDMVTNTVEGIGTLITALGNIFVGLSSTSSMFPNFLFGILLTSCTSLILLRVIGR